MNCFVGRSSTRNGDFSIALVLQWPFVAISVSMIHGLCKDTHFTL